MKPVLKLSLVLLLMLAVMRASLCQYAQSAHSGAEEKITKALQPFIQMGVNTNFWIRPSMTAWTVTAPPQPASTVSSISLPL